MMLKYDQEADAAYVSLSGPIAESAVSRSEDVSRGEQYERGIDYDPQGSILGYEFLNVARGVDLAGLPHQRELTALFEHMRDIRVLEAT